MNIPAVDAADIRVVSIGGLAVIGELVVDEVLKKRFLKKPRVIQLVQNQAGQQGVMLTQFIFEPDELELENVAFLFKVTSIEAIAHYRSNISGLALPRGGKA